MSAHDRAVSAEIARRDFLRAAAWSCFGLTTWPALGRLADAAPAEAIPLRPATARHVIYLYMSGGMSHLDTLDPKPGAETQGPTGVIDTNVDGIRLAEHLPNLARQMDKVALVRSLSTTQGAHSQGRYFLHTSYLLRGTIRHPSLGAWLLRMRGKENPTLPGHVAIGAGPDTAQVGFLEPEFGPLPIGDPTAGLQHGRRDERVAPEQQDRRLERLARMNADFARSYDQKQVRAYQEMYDQAVALMRSRDVAAFDLEQEPTWLREAYGEDKFGQGCLLARRLVEHGVRFVEVVHGGWDTHNDNFEAMDDLCPPLDRGLSALLADLDSRGLLDDTLVVVATEFGRTPDIVTQRMGRNHHPKAFSGLLAGGGIRGGIVHGSTDATGHEVGDALVSVPDFNATIACALGLPLDFEVLSPSGRPFTVADTGRPVTSLFA